MESSWNVANNMNSMITDYIKLELKCQLGSSGLLRVTWEGSSSLPQEVVKGRAKHVWASPASRSYACWISHTPQILAVPTVPLVPLLKISPYSRSILMPSSQMPNPGLCASQTIRYSRCRGTAPQMTWSETSPERFYSWRTLSHVTPAELIPRFQMPLFSNLLCHWGQRPLAACQLQIPRESSSVDSCHRLLRGYALPAPASTLKAPCEGFFLWLIGWLICEIMTPEEGKQCSLSNSPTNVLFLEERTEVIIELTFGG